MIQKRTRPHAIAAVIERLEALSIQNTATIGEIMTAIGRTSFATALLVPALIVMSPLSIIPLLPTVFGLLIAVISVQMLLHRKSLWLPGFLARRRVPTARLPMALKRLHQLADWLDARSRPRFRPLVTDPLSAIPQTLCLVSGLAMPMLEFFPLSSSLLASGVALIAVGFVTRDGLYVAISLSVFTGTLFLIAYFARALF